ncbi:MAG: bifunctional (p)ppGpp synthetase/guanosine-3',5'-bis(diphosphate) 3'-pyrophosphohydrolase [Bacteroidetes bacterium]|nr:bifunctional (p)ppGpp synthetase/guanosine-3',5'-bis(diphosphate) 3'-pyrophosphohydrolase [Bacteroidota bacterium]
METLKKYSEDLQKQITYRYGELIRACSDEYDARGLKLIRKSVDFLIEHTPDGEQKLGMHLTIFALKLAEMTIRELGLDALGVSSVLVMDAVEQLAVPLEEVKEKLGERTAKIIEELLKISNLDTTTNSGQAENMRNLILTLATDFRVILIKITERLFLMRQMHILNEKEQIELSCEARFIYSPLSHRLGLYNVMLEMEDISMSLLEKEAYKELDTKLKATVKRRERFISEFIEPIREDLQKEKLKVEIKGRPKAISSIWRKMKQQKVDFEEVYDKFAIRVIIDTSQKKEKADCWRVYSIITDHYQPNPERLRDWISAPKTNGYESLHTTVVVPGGEWVEVQIRTARMNEIAEKGLAAHWKYKGIKGQKGIDQWIEKVREALESSDVDANNLIEDLKLSQFSKELFVFTPSGDLKKFPENATVLDFAFDIHTDVGSTCVGARVNGKNVPIRYTLRNGDKVEILRSKNQKPKVDWQNVVVTSKAKGKIKQALKEAKLKDSEHGKEILKRRFRNWKIEFDDSSIRKVIQHFKYRDAIELYFDVGTEKIDLLEIKELLTTVKKPAEPKSGKIEDEAVEKLVSHAIHENSDFLVIDDKLSNVEYRLARCCNPIHGDSIFGFVTISSGITIHRMNCPNAQQLLSRYAYRVVKARWTQSEKGSSFPVTLQVTGMDELGIVSNISDVISKDLQVNMRSISIDSNDGMFEGSITLFVKDTQHLEALIRKLKKVKGILNIRRFDN